MRKKHKEYKIYGDLLYDHKPTLRSLMFNYFYNKLLTDERAKTSIYRENAKFVPEIVDLGEGQTKFLAVINSQGTVVEILRMNINAADKLLNKENSLIEFDPDESFVRLGSKYDNGVFVKEEKDEEDSI